LFVGLWRSLACLDERRLNPSVPFGHAEHPSGLTLFEHQVCAFAEPAE
jgi:hypothetical protein